MPIYAFGCATSEGNVIKFYVEAEDEEIATIAAQEGKFARYDLDIII